MDEASLSLNRLRGGGLGEGVPSLGPWKICWRALVMGHHSSTDSIRTPGGRVPLLGNPKDEVLERYAKCPLNGPPSPQGPCWGTWRELVCRDF